jgi:hypothetical protein
MNPSSWEKLRWRILPVTLILHGPGPFDLPRTEHATADVAPSSEVELNLYAAAAEQGDLRLLSTQMTAAAARDLAILLWLAADESEAHARQQK